MAKPFSKLDQIAVLADRTRALILSEKLTGTNTEPVHEDAVETMHQAAPLH
jgi:hypothetical protein